MCYHWRKWVYWNGCCGAYTWKVLHFLQGEIVGKGHPLRAPICDKFNLAVKKVKNMCKTTFQTILQLPQLEIETRKPSRLWNQSNHEATMRSPPREWNHTTGFLLPYRGCCPILIMQRLDQFPTVHHEVCRFGADSGDKKWLKQAVLYVSICCFYI